MRDFNNLTGKDAMIYVASPYSHELEVIRHERYEIAKRWTFNRIGTHGERLFSPIVYVHEHAVKHGLPFDAEFWWKFNQGFLQKADYLYVLQMGGWTTSKGILKEINFAKALIPQIPIVYFEV